MIHELMIESSRPGRTADIAANFSATLGTLPSPEHQSIKAAWISESGELNKYYTLWEYADANHRDSGVAARATASWWLKYRKAVAPDFVGSETILLQPLRPITPPTPGHTLFDFRMYDATPMNGPVYANHLLEILPVRQRYSSNFCIWAPLSGSTDRTFHMWPYLSYEHRADVRAQMAADTEWAHYLTIAFPLLFVQKSSLLRSSPLGTAAL